MSISCSGQWKRLNDGVWVERETHSVFFCISLVVVENTKATTIKSTQSGRMASREVLCLRYEMVHLMLHLSIASAFLCLILEWINSTNTPTPTNTHTQNAHRKKNERKKRSECFLCIQIIVNAPMNARHTVHTFLNNVPCTKTQFIEILPISLPAFVFPFVRLNCPKIR